MLRKSLLGTRSVVKAGVAGTSFQPMPLPHTFSRLGSRGTTSAVTGLGVGEVRRGPAFDDQIVGLESDDGLLRIGGGGEADTHGDKNEAFRDLVLHRGRQ